VAAGGGVSLTVNLGVASINYKNPYWTYISLP